MEIKALAKKFLLHPAITLIMVATAVGSGATIIASNAGVLNSFLTADQVKALTTDLAAVSSVAGALAGAGRSIVTWIDNPKAT